LHGRGLLIWGEEAEEGDITGRELGIDTVQVGVDWDRGSGVLPERRDERRKLTAGRVRLFGKLRV